MPGFGFISPRPGSYAARSPPRKKASFSFAHRRRSESHEAMYDRITQLDRVGHRAVAPIHGARALEHRTVFAFVENFFAAERQVRIRLALEAAMDAREDARIPFDPRCTFGAHELDAKAALISGRAHADRERMRI